MRAGGHWLPRFPFVLAEVIGHRADGVYRVIDQVDDAVVVEVNGIGLIAGGDELPKAHGARVGACDAVGINMRTLFQFEQGL